MNALKINFQLLHRGRALFWLAGVLVVSSTPAAITVSPPPDTGAAPAAATTNVSPRAISLAEAVTPLRLTLELRDGSRVIGVPSVTNLQVRSSFGAIGLDLTRLQTLQFVEGKGTAEFLLQNGDKVSGVLNLETLEMKTSFGPVKIPVAVVRRLSVNPGGKSRGGLVLHYGFDDDENDMVRDKSGQGHDGKLLGAQWVASRGDPALARAAKDLIAKIGAAVPERLRPYVLEPASGAPPARNRMIDKLDMARTRAQGIIGDRHGRASRPPRPNAAAARTPSGRGSSGAVNT